MASKYSAGAGSYPEVTAKAIVEMNRQVGVARPGSDGRILRGLMLRHLVMPNDVSGTHDLIKWIAANLPKETYLNIMSQYRPYYKAQEYPEIARGITRDEFSDAIRSARAGQLCLPIASACAILPNSSLGEEREGRVVSL